MGVETVVGLPDQLAVESFLAHARLVAGHEQDRLALCVEGEGHSPFAIRRAEAQFLACSRGGSRSGCQRGAAPIACRTAEEGQGQNLGLHVLVQRVELPVKLIADLNSPTHLL